jgi:periplasmic copper chaperone A
LTRTEVTDGFDLAPDAELVFERGGNHIMFMGLTAPFKDGQTIAVTLVFEKAGEVEVLIPVDLARIEDGMTMQHGTDHSTQPSN